MSTSETRFAVLLFSDIVGSTDLKQRHGVPAFAEALRVHNAHFERAAGECRGIRILQNMGDGYFAEGDSVSEVVKFALLFQDAMRAGPWGEMPLTARVGIHAGEVSAMDAAGGSGLMGPAADLAARVMSLAVGGQILLTRFPFDEARHFLREHPPVAGKTMPPLHWLAHGPYLMKGRDEPLDIFEVGPDGLAPLAPPPDGEKAKRHIRPGEEETLGWRPAVGLEVPSRAGWMLARKIGEGGFGEVWLAEQGTMKQQRVFKFCFDEERLRSFKRELTFFRLIRDALGERPDIARLYDVKLDEPPFFLESEFAEHGNLTEWCEEQGGIGAVPLPRRLELVAQVAEAVAAAHSVGILHKDLKPQNVLMQMRPGGEAAPQITDFGIGALADKAALAAHAITAVGFTVNTIVSRGSGSSMTRLYAAPEQLAGKPYTVQGDVYALGVMLWQLVIGDFTRALAPGWEREVKDALLREDLAECLDGEPARRLASAAELAERLRSLETRRAARTAEHQRAAVNARRKRTARLASVIGAVAVVVAVALGAGLFRERALRQRADAAEQLANARLTHAQEARDAAEKLVTEAVFGLREKLVPLGKVSVIEGLATAAEEYYAKLPADLVSDVTRHHEVMLALNRAIVACASSDDEMCGASCKKALVLARALSAKAPGDESLREGQYLALVGLANLRISQDRREEASTCAQELLVLADEWLRTQPKSLGALRTKLAGHCVKLMATQDSAKDPATLIPLFLQAQAIADELKKTGGETLETRVLAAANLAGKALLMNKLGRREDAVRLFAESDAAFRVALAVAGDHHFVRETMLLVRKLSLDQLIDLAKERGDVALEREALRQTVETLAEQTALAEFEPARLERWKGVGWLYVMGGPLVKKLEGAAAWQAWLEKGIVAADRAVSPKFYRRNVHRLRCVLRLDLCEALQATRADGWETRAFKLLAETVDIDLAPSSAEPAMPGQWHLWEDVRRWREAHEALGDQPGQRPALVAQARAIAAFAQQIIDGAPESSQPRREAVEGVGKVEIFLRQRGCAEAAELAQFTVRWRAELEEKFADDPEVILDKCRKAQDRCWALLGAMGGAAAVEKDARLAELETHARETVAFIEKHRIRLPDYEYGYLRGGCLTALGSALIDREQFPSAEAALREAVHWRGVSADKTTDLREAQNRRWEVADAQGRLAYTIFRQGREDEARKLGREAVEMQAAIAAERHDPYHFRMAANAWRGHSRLLPPVEMLSARQKSAELFRESIRLARLDANEVKNELPWCLIDAPWGMLELGDSQRDAGHPKEAEAAYREALGLVSEKMSASRPENLSDITFQSSALRHCLADLFFKQSRADEAREQVEQIGRELQQLEATAGAKAETIERLRKTLGELRNRLPAP